MTTATKLGTWMRYAYRTVRLMAAEEAANAREALRFRGLGWEMVSNTRTTTRFFFKSVP